MSSTLVFATPPIYRLHVEILAHFFEEVLAEDRTIEQLHTLAMVSNYFSSIV
ncbi:hypothetical protein FRB98_001423, partial [Tulasnella sp. 332]